MWIILTPEQAETVRGLYAESAFLSPLLLVDSNYALPVCVLAASCYAEVSDYLKTLPKSESVNVYNSMEE